MKKDYSKIIRVAIVIGIFLFIYITRFNINKNTSIDMTGNNDMWKASLNMHISYSNELVITLVTEEFESPSQIGIDILAKDKSIYTNELKKEKSDVFPDYGVYRCRFDSIKYLEKNYKDVSVIISFNNKIITIPLTSIKIME